MAASHQDESAVLLVHTEYGKDKVGSSFLHRQVVETIREHEPDIPVFSTVLHATEKDKQDAQEDGVELILPKVEPGDPRIDPTPHWLTFDHRSKYPDLPTKVRSIVGHADVTSRAAINIKDGRCPEAKVVLIYNDTSKDTRGNEKVASVNNSAHQNAQEADVVFSVGNKVFDHFENQFRATDKKPKHFEFLPRPSKKFEHTKASYKDTKTMTVLSIGIVKSVHNLKGHDLVVKALDIAAVKQNMECGIRGINEEDFQASDKDILQTHFKTTHLKQTLLPYGTLTDLHNDMLKAHLVLIPSEEEPFELAGLDAIAAGIPVLVSDKSGLADFMTKISPEFCYSVVVTEGDEQDKVKQWAKRIEQSLSNCETEFERAARCRDKLLSAKYWEESHQQLICSCIQTGDSVQQPFDVQTESAPPNMEEAIDRRKPLQSGGPSREADEDTVTERTDQSETEMGSTKTPAQGASILYQASPQLVEGPPLLPVVVDIIAQVKPSVKTPGDMLDFASALNVIDSTVTESGDETLTNSLLKQIKASIKTITDLKTVTKAIKELEKFKGIKVSSLKEGSLIFYLQCTDMSGLGDLWFMYKNGELDNLLHSSLVSEETLQQLHAESISVKSTINIEDFRKALVHILTTSSVTGLQKATSMDNLSSLMRPCTDERKEGRTSLEGLDLVITSTQDSSFTELLAHPVTRQLAYKVRRQTQQIATLEGRLEMAKHQAEIQEGIVKSLHKEVSRLSKKDEEAQKVLMSKTEEVHQLQEANRGLEATIEALTAAKTKIVIPSTDEDDTPSGTGKKSLQELRLEMVELRREMAEQHAAENQPDIVARWDLLRKHSRDIATCLDTEKTCLLLLNADVLTDRERTVIEREESPPERARTLLRILPTKGPNAFHAFREALKDQGRDDLAALLAGEPGRVYSPVSNFGKPVSHFYTSEDARKVNAAMEGGRSVVVLSGITGSGKTQLALWQAQLFVERHPTAVVWRLDGHDKKSFLTDKQNLLQALKEKVPTDDSQVDACVAKALDSRKTPVLLILDNLDDGLVLSPALLKPRKESKILVITQCKRLQHSANVSIPEDCYISINGFLMDEAVNFLQMKLHNYPADELQRLVTTFSGLPMGLAAARNYMLHSNVSVENLLTLIEKRETFSKLEEMMHKFMSQFYERPEIQQTGRKLFDNLRQAVSKLDKQTRSMFQLTAYMDKSRIPIVVLKEDVNDSPAMRNEALNLLVMEVENLSLGTVEGVGNDRVISVHEVTQMVMRLSWTEDQERERLKRLQDILLKYFVKDNRYTKSGRLAELLQPHVEKVLRYAKAVNDDGGFCLALARLSEVCGFMNTQCGMPGKAEEHLRAAKDHLEQLAGIDWRDVNYQVIEKLRAYGYISIDDGDITTIEEKSIKEAEVLYLKLSEASKRLPDEVFATMIQSRVIADQELALFRALGKAPAGLAESVRNKEPLTQAQYQEMVEDGIAIDMERLKAAYLPELYASIHYSLGRCFFFMKEKYANDPAGKDRLIRSMQLAYYLCDQIKKHTGIPVLHKYLSEVNALLYLRLEEEGKSPEDLRRDITYARRRYSEFVEGRGEYFEFGILKKSGQDSYGLMVCLRQLVKCFHKLIKLSESEEERLAYFEQAQTECRNMIMHAEQQVETDAYGNIVERPERLADFYNTAGKFLADDGDSKKLEEALDWFQKAYDLETETGKEDYPLSDALFGLAEGLARRNHGDDLVKAEGYVGQLLELYNRKWPGKREQIKKAQEIQVRIAQLK